MSNCKDNIQNIIINQKQQSSLSYLKVLILYFIIGVYFNICKKDN